MSSSNHIASKQYLEEAKKAFEKVKNKQELDMLKSRYLGKKSELNLALSKLHSLSVAERAKEGVVLNKTKKTLNEYMKIASVNLTQRDTYAPVDLSAPGVTTNAPEYGHTHPTNLVLAETYQIFSELGFAIVDSDEIETDWYNFEALRMPESHPAREMQDTFYIKSKKMNLVPRTHTSGMQVRFMENNKPPFKIIVPGRVFRNEDEDVTHNWSFHQIEGLVVGENVSLSDLKGTLLHIVRGLLGDEVEIRFRPSYFPYTEPSVELDCKYMGKWLELGGAGMVHPDVLRNGGIDPRKYTGFAFGWGAERVASIKYGLKDLRLLWRANFEFLEQFK